MYQSRQPPSEIPFRRSRQGGPFQTQPDYMQWLDDLGTGFNHSRVPTLRLNDLFVPPAVFCRIVKANSETRLERRHEIDGADLFSHIFDAKRFILLGQQMAGKTTLGKAFYKDSLTRNVYPLWVKGEDLTASMIDNIDRHLRRMFEQQYKGEWDRYNQLPPASKLLIVDDVHMSPLNRRALGAIMRQLTARFGRILLCADEFFGAQAFSPATEEETYLADFGTGTIQEFGHYLRSKLIEKWEILGRESTMTREELSYDVRKIEKVISGVMNKNFISSLPVMTLTILQAWESTKTPDLSSGSYGYLQQTLILRALSTVRLTQPELDVALRFLALVAYTMFAKDADVLSSSEWTELEHQYHREFRVPLPGNLLARLQAARIVRSGAGQLEFQYPYYYCYFVARHLWETLQTEETAESPVRAYLDRMIRGVHYEQYANILTFYVFFTRDLVTIRRIIANAKTILAEYPPCNFESDVAFVNALYKGQGPPFTLPSAENEKNADEYRKKLDRDECANVNAPLERDDRSVVTNPSEREEEVSEFARINVATKMLHILGQIVRNSPGSLKADLKQEIITEAYNLGLRTLKVLLTVPSDNIDDVRRILISMIEAERENRLEIMKERNAMSHLPELRKEDLLKKADEGVIWLAESFGYGITRRIALAIGMEELSDIYADVLKSTGGELAYHIVDMAVKLEYFKEPPEREIKILFESLRKNQYAQDTVRALVLTYLYLNPVEYKRRQRLETGILGFSKGGSAKLLDNPSKKKRRE